MKRNVFPLKRCVAETDAGEADPVLAFDGR
jgi:hypothetical protein